MDTDVDHCIMAVLLETFDVNNFAFINTFRQGKASIKLAKENGKILPIISIWNQVADCFSIFWVKKAPCYQASVVCTTLHNWGIWGLFEMLEGGPIAVWSESGLEAWNKHIRNFRSGARCRAR